MELSRDTFESKKEATYMDRPFIRILVKKIQELDPDIGAVLFEKTMQVVFYWRNIILYKVTLNELNTDEIGIEKHVKTVGDRIRYIKLGLLQIRPLQETSSGFNKKKTGKLL